MAVKIDRIITAQTVQLNDLKVPRSVVEFQEPKYNPIYEEIDGTFIAERLVVGYETVEGSVQIKGVGAKVAMGAIKNGAKNVIIFTEKGMSDGEPVNKEHTITALVKAEFTPSKVKERQTLTLTFSVSKHKLVDDGETVVDVDIKNGLYKIYGEEFKA